MIAGARRFIDNTWITLAGRPGRETWMNRLTGCCSRRTTISGSVPCARIPHCSPLTRKKLDHSSIPISPASSKERPRSVSAPSL